MASQAKTFVFFDTESTGLPNQANPPKITELSFLAVSKGELNGESTQPRVINKLTLCFNPEKEITPTAADVSGLTNACLQDFPTFREQAPMVTHFLRHLPQPVCLAAHNGDRFDFPLLARHLEDAGVDLSDLGEVWCADTLRAFKEVCPMPYYKLRQVYINACGKQPRDIHSAEDDSEMLMNIVHCKDTQFLITWFNNQSKPLIFFGCPPEDFCTRLRSGRY